MTASATNEGNLYHVQVIDACEYNVCYNNNTFSYSRKKALFAIKTVIKQTSWIIRKIWFKKESVSSGIKSGTPCHNKLR